MPETLISGRLPPLNALRAFEATARRGSVSAAARELKVTHGAVSHQVRGLEEALGMTLFERGGNRLKLTAQGALLLPALSRAFGDIAAATARMQRPEASGTLSLTCVSGFLSFWLLPRLDRFTAQYPAITLNLTASNDPADAADPDVDVAIRYGRSDVAACWSRLLSHLRLFPVVSPSLINSRALRTVRDLRHHVLLHADDGAEWTTWFAAADAVDLPRHHQHFLGDARLSTEAALLGQGVALGDNLTTANLIARGDLTIPFDLSVPANDAFYVSCRNDMRTAPIVKAFVDWLFATIETDAIPETEIPIKAPHRPRAAANPTRAIAASASPTRREPCPDKDFAREPKI